MVNSSFRKYDDWVIVNAIKNKREGGGALSKFYLPIFAFCRVKYKASKFETKERTSAT